ncbi:MAG: 5-formyltetrahydrofolate cyclo-ligase [Gammaproteobacteria bacterium]|nr:5-formyltetrahydrofolate cyclo-ligase [Gammaproteobacteria bacterium]
MKILDKSTLRQTLRDKRRAVDSETRTRDAEHAAEYLEKSALFQASAHIACYFSTKEEFDSNAIIQLIFKHNKKCYLPALHSTEKKLLFARYQPNDPLEENRYRISQPLPHAETISAEELNLVFLPLVSFDLQGHRLGMGAGFYDRTFAFKKSPRTSCHLMGLAYSFQETESLPYDEWDIKLDSVLTEKGITLFHSL